MSRPATADAEVSSFYRVVRTLERAVQRDDFSPVVRNPTLLALKLCQFHEDSRLQQLVELSCDAVYAALYVLEREGVHRLGGDISQLQRSLTNVHSLARDLSSQDFISAAFSRCSSSYRIESSEEVLRGLILSFTSVSGNFPGSGQ
ncbi:hypothetical protein PM082_007292 [Marasmius tenuissimus]|nr:hypothetical protein PM082_007292 [Marasmius tenuissimus]